MPTLSKDEILDAIANMTVLELSELLKDFEEKFGVTAAAPVAVAAAGGAGGGAAAEAEEEQEERAGCGRGHRSPVDGGHGSAMPRVVA